MMKDDKVASFNMCMKNGKELCSEYVGFDYNLAFDLHLYNVMTKSIMEWAIENHLFSVVLLDKLELRAEVPFSTHELDPLDLYVRHISPAINFVMKRALLYLEPTRRDEMLKKFRTTRTSAANNFEAGQPHSRCHARSRHKFRLTRACCDGSLPA